LVALLGVLLLSGGLAGCGDSASQTQVEVTPSAVQTGENKQITPLERGALRREILGLCETALAAWLSGDVDVLKDHCAEDVVNGFVAAQDRFEAEGKTHVREHERVFLDMTDLNLSGTQAMIEYRFKDGSYFTNGSGQRLSEPTGEEELVQLTWEKTDDGWRLVRVYGAPDIFS
jgi:hypothetical protein